VYWYGNWSFKQVRLVENHISLANLPAAFEGYRILQVSDLHADLDPTLTPRILTALEGVEYDLAVVTGDFRDSTARDFGPSLRESAPIPPGATVRHFGKSRLYRDGAGP
jgi:predicted MPP superfamily phosphohydrolase